MQLMFDISDMNGKYAWLVAASGGSLFKQHCKCVELKQFAHCHDTRVYVVLSALRVSRGIAFLLWASCAR